MNNERKEISVSKDDKGKTVKSVSTSDNNGNTKNISVKESDNGYFIMNIYKSWKDKDGNYQSKEECIVSKEDPFAKEKEKEKEETSDIEKYFSNAFTFGEKFEI